jgi:hypothetical protein
MVVPLDAIQAFHNAFRKDMETIDTAAYYAARGQAGLDLVASRYIFFNDILVWHAVGEEEFVFTALETVAPMVAEAYKRDHRGLDALFDLLDEAVKASDRLAIARTTAAFKFHLDIHLNKEEAHLYKIFDEKISLPNQQAIMGKMAQKIPRERLPEVVRWIYPLIGNDDRENMTRIWRQALPQDAFAGVTRLIQEAIGNDWAELVRRIPELKQ